MCRSRKFKFKFKFRRLNCARDVFIAIFFALYQQISWRLESDVFSSIYLHFIRIMIASAFFYFICIRRFFFHLFPFDLIRFNSVQVEVPVCGLECYRYTHVYQSIQMNHQRNICCNFIDFFGYCGAVRACKHKYLYEISKKK